jgi:lambda family phage portal protein
MSFILDQHGRPYQTAEYSGGFEGATHGNRLSGWGISSMGPNAAIEGSLASLRNRQAELVRNNPLAGGGVDTIVANMVGRGIRPIWNIEDKDLLRRVQDRWTDSVEEADADGVASFYGLQAIVAGAMCNTGEGFGVFSYPSPYDGLATPVQVRVFEGAQLDEAHTELSASGNDIRMGIEMGKDGRRAAYHFFREHPGEPYFRNTFEKKRVAAGEVMHVYRPLRPGQLRGLPWFHNVILKLHEIDECVDAELVRRKTTTMFGGFIKETQAGFPLPPGGTGAVPGGPPGNMMGNQSKTANGAGVIDLRPGTFPFLPKGWDVVFSQPTDVGGNYVAWMIQELRNVAKGMGVTYEQLTGDLSGVNLSSIRAGLLDFRRRLEQVVAMTLVFQFCRPFAIRWFDLQVATGGLVVPDYFARRAAYLRVKWQPDGWDWVDPVKDVKAAIMEVRAGFNSRQRVVARRHGVDVEVVDREIKEDNRRADGAGLVLDTDPRKTTIGGIYQDGGQGNEEDDDDAAGRGGNQEGVQ